MGKRRQSFSKALRETIMQISQLPRLICLIGVDGSGKTTLAKTFEKEANKIGLKYRYVWGNAQPIFIRPLRWLAHLTLLRDLDMQKDNDRYEKVKEAITTKHISLSRIYARILIIDYIIWLLLKIKFPLFFGERIICDRYVFDVAVNLYFLDRNHFANVSKTIRSLFKYFPQPDLLYLLDVPISVAYERKEDIPSLRFLEKRQGIYRRIGGEFNAKTLDGCQPISTSIKILTNDING